MVGWTIGTIVAGIQRALNFSLMIAEMNEFGIESKVAHGRVIYSVRRFLLFSPEVE